jgi:hypothetical protein
MQISTSEPSDFPQKGAWKQFHSHQLNSAPGPRCSEFGAVYMVLPTGKVALPEYGIQLINRRRKRKMKIIKAKETRML